MLAQTENLSIKILRADKMFLQKIAQLEGEPVSVVVRRILRNEIRRQKPVENVNQDLSKVRSD